LSLRNLTPTPGATKGTLASAYLAEETLTITFSAPYQTPV